ncbi:hypothetical protein [Nonomuraea sp. 10N515B]|uniref:hypothetical protein n=1 Tax=Nonomuraea sp. 10N515B TaxID=3457422 RepID=UPI003FCE43D5
MSESGRPRWVKVLALVAAIVIVLLIAVMLLGVGGGGHTPMRHGAPGLSYEGV